MKKEKKSASKLLAVVPSTTARRLLWHAFSLDTACLTAPDHHEPYEKPGAHLFWILSGHGTLETEGHKYLLQPGNSVWFVDMTKVRTYAPVAGQQLVKRGLRFGGPALESWHNELGGSRQAQFELADASIIHNNSYREIWNIIQRKRAGWEWEGHMVLTRMLGVLLASRNQLSSVRVELPAPVVRVLNAIEAKPFYDWKVKDLAPIAGVSYSGLRTLFYEVQHENLHDFIQRSRLSQARLLLSDPGLSIKQIAEQMQFSSEFYFSHFFKKLEGVSPRDFRRQRQNKR
ncbi:MAG: AraC family transcriptional regulator [Verrucomicrobia bacterium]|nr:AraC family transcriptional regulator [Verrucomicrobiota bacterium]